MYNRIKMSPEQENMWFLYNQNKSSDYNVQFYLEFNGKMEEKILKSAVDLCIARNDLLRSKVVVVEGVCYCEISDEAEIEVEKIQLHGDESQKTHQESKIMLCEKKRIFDLENEYPLRMKWIVNSVEKSILLVTTHHIYFDAWSVGIFANEIGGLYKQIAKNITPNRNKENKFADYVSYMENKNFEKEKAYWKEELKGSTRVGIEHDYCSRLDSKHYGGVEQRKIYASMKLKEYCRKYEVSSASVFLAAYNLTLSKYSGQMDISIGTPVLNRNYERFREIIGYFANTVVIREVLSMKDSIPEFVQKINKKCVLAQIHGSIPINEVVSTLNVKRLPYGNPLYNVMFSMRGKTLFGEFGYSFKNITESLTMRLVNVNESEKVQFELICTIDESADGYLLTLAYDNDIYAAEHISMIANDYISMLDRVLSDKDAKVSECLQDRKQRIYMDAEKNHRLEDLILDMVNVSDVRAILCKNILCVFYVAQKTLLKEEWEPLLNCFNDKIAVFRVYDFVCDNEGNTDYEYLHKVARCAIEKNGELQEQITIFRRRKQSVKGYPEEMFLRVKQFVTKENIYEEDALLEGEPLISPKCRTLAELIAKLDESSQGQLITILNGTEEITFTYKDLFIGARSIAEGLQKEGITKNDIIVLVAGDIEENLKAFWACMLVGARTVILSAPNDGDFRKVSAERNKLISVMEVTDFPAVLAGDKETRSLSVCGVKNIENKILNIQKLSKNSGKNFIMEDIEKDDIALMLFTSGSTGVPKGVQLTHGNIIARTAGVCQRLGFDKDDVSMNWMPLDHVGGIVMSHVSDIYAGERQVYIKTVEILKNPIRWLEILSEYKATYTWAPNFAFGLLVGRGEEIAKKSFDLSSMRIMLNGGEAINYETCSKFLEMMKPFGLKSNAMVPAWGMTETSSGVLISERFGEILYNNTVGTGSPNPGVKARIVSPDGRILKAGEEGLLQISGVTINAGYYNNEEENNKCFTKDGWFDTGDLAIITQGEVIITGRSKDLLIMNGMNISCQEIEKKLEQIKGIGTGEIACTSIKRKEAASDEVVIFYGEHNSEKREYIKTNINELLINEYGFMCKYLVPVVPSEIPRTSIGKIDKKKLLVFFKEGKLQALDGKFGQDIPSCIGWICRYPENLRILPKRRDVKSLVYFLSDDRNVYTDQRAMLDRMRDIKNLLDTVRSNQTYQLIVICNSNLHSVSDGIKGFLTCIPLEYKNMKVLFLEHEGLGKERLEAIIDNELNSFGRYPQKYAEVYYDCSERRFVSKIERVNILDMPVRQEKKTGTYVILGGLGGVGQILCKRMLDEGNCIIIVGRTEIQKMNALKKGKLKELMESGAVTYKSVELASAKDVNDILQEFGEINGIINLIGEETAEMHKKNEEQFLIRNQDFDDGKLFRTAITQGIAEYSKDKQDMFILNLSSATAFFGGRSYCMYSAASRYIYEYQLRNLQCEYYSFAFGRWDGIGMNANESKAEKQAAENAGYYSINGEIGIGILEELVCRHIRKALVGIDFTSDRLKEFTFIKDECDYEMEKSEDRILLQADKEIERDLITIWKDVLGINSLSPQENFFEVGGDSAKSIYLIERINNEFNCGCSVVDLFRNPTVRNMALFIENKDKNKVESANIVLI